MDHQQERPGRPEDDGPFVPYLPPRQPEDDDGPGPRRHRGWWIAASAVVVIAVAVFVVWPLLSTPSGERTDVASPGPSISRNAEPGLDGIIATEVPPAQVQPGDCLTDFSSVDEPATVVECDREHEAQLVGRKLWPTGRAFPQDMRGAAEEFCGSIELTSVENASVVVEISHPAEGTWADGDRRVDCTAVAQDGVLSSALVDEPVMQDWTNYDDAQSPSPAASSSSS
ncbi:hypothetical protein [Citricoccus sp. GCM10030269]|uniref:hypothetical protein n=1 Tax=Citricoccus sp. GCM10030269 TaxID=3273388 RepID=UPI00361CC1C8